MLPPIVGRAGAFPFLSINELQEPKASSQDSPAPSPRTYNETAIWSANEVTSSDAIGATRLRRDHIFIERVIMALEAFILPYVPNY